MGRIQPCVKDVLHIAYKTEDFSQAKARIEQLFVEAKGGTSRASRSGATSSRSDRPGL